MIGFDEKYASHIGRVEVNFFVSALDLDPAEISQITGLLPDKGARRGDERRNHKGKLIRPHTEGFWMIASESRIDSKDINDHIEVLLALLLPHKEKLLQIVDAKGGETYFDVVWTSNYLYAGTGPVISRPALKGISDLGASIGFDIYQDEANDTES